jgi:hypothetical protein
MSTYLLLNSFDDGSFGGVPIAKKLLHIAKKP